MGCCQYVYREVNSSSDSDISSTSFLIEDKLFYISRYDRIGSGSDKQIEDGDFEVYVKNYTNTKLVGPLILCDKYGRVKNFVFPDYLDLSKDYGIDLGDYQTWRVIAGKYVGNRSIPVDVFQRKAQQILLDMLKKMDEYEINNGALVLKNPK